MKLLKLTVLHILKRVGVFSVMRFVTRHGVRILCYHGVWLGDEGYPGDAMFMNQHTFESRLECLRKWRFPVVPLAQVMTSIKLPSCPVVITIDDGWFSSYSVMWPALIRKDMPATLYCDTAHLLSRHPVPHVMVRYFKTLVETGYAGHTKEPDLNQNAYYKEALQRKGETTKRLDVASQFAKAIDIDYDYYVCNKVFNYMLPEHLAEAYKDGLDVQLHTHNHTMHHFKADELAREIDENRLCLSQILNAEPENFSHFCYPSGEYSRDLTEALDGLGILSSTTTNQSIAYLENDRQFLPRILDGEQLKPIEFEAELCGVMDMLRSLRNVFNTNLQSIS